METNTLGGKNALIINAGQSGGRSIASEIARQGATIYFTEFDELNLKQSEIELKRKGIEATGYHMKNLSKEEIVRLWENLNEKSLKIDVLIINAGSEILNIPKVKFDSTEWENLFETSILGPLNIAKRVGMKMVENKSGGAIVFVFPAGQYSIKRVPSYNVIQSALNTLIAELAIDFASYNIRVNGVSVGYNVNNENSSSFSSGPLRHSSSQPHRYVARAVGFLASDYQSFHTTGAILQIDGGLALPQILMEEE